MEYIGIEVEVVIDIGIEIEVVIDLGIEIRIALGIQIGTKIGLEIKSCVSYLIQDFKFSLLEFEQGLEIREFGGLCRNKRSD